MNEPNPDLPNWSPACDYTGNRNIISRAQKMIDIKLAIELSRDVDYETVCLKREKVTLIHRGGPDEEIWVWALYFCEHSDHVFEYLINASCYMDALRWVLERYDIIPESGMNLNAIYALDGWGDIPEDELYFTQDFWDYRVGKTV